MNTIVDLLDRAYMNWNMADRLGEIGTELESRSRLALARKVLGRAVELEPNAKPEWYASLAFAHFRDTGNMAEEGERLLVEGIETTDSDMLKAWHGAFVDEEDIAEQIFAIVHNTPDVGVQFTYGQALLWRGRNDQALMVMRQAIKRVGEGETPVGLDTYVSAMNWMAAQGAAIDIDTEIQPYIDRLIATSPNVYQYRSLQLQRYQVEKNWEKVRDTALETLQIFPDEETVMLALAGAYEKLGDDNRAILWYNRAIGAKYSYVRARVQLGRIYERLGMNDLAAQVFREIPAANPGYHMGSISLAAYLYRSGNLEEAQAVFNKTYSRLKPFEKGGLEHNPDTKVLFERMNTAGAAR
jgi:tetratricopeptide (TPR) repeat protein